MITCDYLIIGGGVLGLSTARELKKRQKQAKIVILEKEPDCGLHASGRNSGVLHAGFYYSADSLKAQFSQAGNQELTAFCQERRLSLNPCGKLVVAKDATELDTLNELYQRGNANGAKVELITAARAKEIEPRVKTHDSALYSPTTSTINPRELMQCLKELALVEGILIHTNATYTDHIENEVMSSRGNYSADFVINCSGLYADKIAKSFGFSSGYEILPFKGLYLYSSEPAGAFKTHIYPVPNLKNPFLGVHLTVTVDGKAKLGPTAIPAFWREQYEGLSNFDLSECSEILLRELRLLFNAGFDFKGLAREELKKYLKFHLVSLSQSLADGIETKHYKEWGQPGIRAQLINNKTNKLVTDFFIEKDSKSLHVLNAVSPGLTCAFPFARHIVDHII